MTVREQFEARHKHVLVPAAEKLERYIAEHLRTSPAVERIDRIAARAKSVSRFIDKAEKLGKDGKPKYADPLGQIQDQIGARVIVFYRDDIQPVKAKVEKYFRAAEQKAREPESRKEFGYFGFHYILMLPDDVVPSGVAPELVPPFFELQIRTLFQHAWSEGGHDLAYKPPRPLTADEERLVAYSAASAWGADKILQDLYYQVYGIQPPTVQDNDKAEPAT
jgi:putative GTP pyrophosphokinase